MPSKDDFHAKNPRLNESLRLEPVSGKRRNRLMSGMILRLAERLGKNPDEIAARIPEDTLRRTKYPVIETENEDGSRSFKHDPGIEDGGRTAS